MKKTILVAEDDPRNRKLVCELLDVKGYAVIQVQNGKTAVDEARERLPDLILMDMQMPVMDGYEAVRILKGDATTSAIPVWALTSYAMPGDEKRIRDLGCAEYISKPIDTKEFLQKIEHHFAGRAS